MNLRKLFVLILLPMVFFPSGVSQASGEGKRLKKWEKKVAETIRVYMWAHGEKEVWFHQPQGKPYKFLVTQEFLENQVAIDFDASRFNPSWGPRALVCLKQLVYQYGESRYDRYAVNINRIGSVDFGLGQINSCHLLMLNGEKSCGFVRFCKSQDIKPDLKWIWNPYFNSLFSATLNECFVREKHSTYHYFASDGQKDLYDALLKSTGLKQQALVYNDGQYFDRDATVGYASAPRLPEVSPVTQQVLAEFPQSVIPH